MMRAILVFLIGVLVVGGRVGYGYAGIYGLILEATIATAILVLVVRLVLDLRPKIRITPEVVFWDCQS